MATDPKLHGIEDDRLDLWAPIHAWRAWGQMQAEAATVPLTTILNKDSDWVWEELPKVFSLIGPASIPALSTVISDPTQEGAAVIQP